MAEETQAADAVPQISFKKRTNKAKANFRKKPDTPPPASDSDSDFTSSDDEEGRRIKRRRKNAAVTASSTTAGPRRNVVEDQPATETAAIPLTSSNDATKHSNWYDEELSEKNLLGTTRARPASNTQSAPDGTYKGAANYSSFIQKNPNAPTKQFGPIKAPTNVRTVTVMDFAPDVCKDWKQTGFCGFGGMYLFFFLFSLEQLLLTVAQIPANFFTLERTTNRAGSWTENGRLAPKASN
ncbi:RNA-splicing factor, variant 2 [Aspergillus fumigatus]